MYWVGATDLEVESWWLTPTRGALSPSCIEVDSHGGFYNGEGTKAFFELLWTHRDGFWFAATACRFRDESGL